jgi:hypothetical protein
MKTFDPIVARELPIIQKIIQDETWLEGERRGCHVLPTDPVVRQKTCEVILRIGAELRQSLSRQSLSREVGPVFGLPALELQAPAASMEQDAA